MLVLSLGVNILVLVPVLLSLYRRTSSADAAFGPDSVARRILACLYGTILIASVALLGLMVGGFDAVARTAGATLLCLQVVYKLATLPAVGAHSPVVVANLFIALVHIVTLTVLFLTGT